MIYTLRDFRLSCPPIAVSPYQIRHEEHCTGCWTGSFEGCNLLSTGWGQAGQKYQEFPTTSSSEVERDWDRAGYTKKENSAVVCYSAPSTFPRTPWRVSADSGPDTQTRSRADCCYLATEKPKHSASQWALLYTNLLRVLFWVLWFSTVTFNNNWRKCYWEAS